jgi:hypothetical protein
VVNQRITLTLKEVAYLIDLLNDAERRTGKSDDVTLLLTKLSLVIGDLRFAPMHYIIAGDEQYYDDLRGLD